MSKKESNPQPPGARPEPPPAPPGILTDNTAVIRTLEACIAELVAERDRLRNLVKKSQDEVVSFVPMLVELAALREAAGELVANAEWDGDISTVDTGDLKALRAELLQESDE